jgi:type IV pilus assembly protein PilO
MKSFHELSSRAQLAVFAVLCALTIAAAWQLLLAPERIDLATRQAGLARVETDVAKASAVARELPAFEREIASLEQDLARTTASLPDEKDAQDVLRQLHALALASALDISSFTPKPMTARSVYSEWPIELGLDGGFHDLGRFFDRVADLGLLISVSNLHLTATTRPGARGAVTAVCTATTYVFRHDDVGPVRGKS